MVNTRIRDHVPKSIRKIRKMERKKKKKIRKKGMKRVIPGGFFLDRSPRFENIGLDRIWTVCDILGTRSSRYRGNEHSSAPLVRSNVIRLCVSRRGLTRKTIKPRSRIFFLERKIYFERHNSATPPPPLPLPLARSQPPARHVPIVNFTIILKMSRWLREIAKRFVSTFRCCNVCGTRIHFITLETTRRATKTSEETPPLSCFSLFFPSSPLRCNVHGVPDSLESVVLEDIKTFTGLCKYPVVYLTVSRYVKRTRTTHSRFEFGVVSLLYLCLYIIVFGQRKHGK